MTTHIVARAEHHARYASHTLQLRQQQPRARWLLADAGSQYLMHIALWSLFVALLVLALRLDAITAMHGMAAVTGGLFSGYFRRRTDVDEQLDDVDVLELADPHEPGPLERTDVIPVIRRHKRPHQDVRRAYGRASRTIHVLRGTNALLREQFATADDIARHHAERLAECEQALTAATTGARLVERDNHELEQANTALRTALDEHRPAPDPHQLAERLAQVWWTPSGRGPMPNVRGYIPDLERRWQDVARAAVDTLRGLWPIEAWPLTPAELEHNAPADSIAADEPVTDEQREQLARTLARRDLMLTDATWSDVVDKDHYRGLAGDVITAGWRPVLPAADPPPAVVTAEATGEVL